MVFLVHSYKRNNPLTRCILLVLRLLCVTPVLITLTVAWYIIIMNLLFLRGVFVLVIYTVSTAGIIHKKVGGILILITIRALFSSLTVFYIPSYIGLRRLFVRYNLGLLLFIILFLVFLILFRRYIVRSGAAIRRM